jgi:cell surface protein SprA
MFMTGFNQEVTVRFGALDLVRGMEKVLSTLDFNDINVMMERSLTSAVNIQENNQRCPINYITPPGVRREQLFNNNTIINQNEQSLSLRVSVKIGT